MFRVAARLIATLLPCVVFGCKKAPEPEPVALGSEPAAKQGADTSDPDTTDDDASVINGPRAPTTEAFGFALGKTTRAEVEARLQDIGITCSDTGPRALMQGMRDKKKAEIEEAEKTSDADAVSGASMLYKKSKHEKNPQVRLSCSDTKLSQLGVERAVDAPGRTLIIFDDPDAPLRHVSSRRNHDDLSAAQADVQAAVAAWTELLGPPTSIRGDLLAEEPQEPSSRWEWVFGDFYVRVGSLGIGGKRFSVSERAEVPMKVRADAPTLARGPQEAAPAEPQ